MLSQHVYGNILYRLMLVKKKFVEDGLSIIANSGVRYALFPMTTPGVGIDKLDEFSKEIHWTLFEYDTVDCIWYYYNSILSRNCRSYDLYYAEALILAAFVHRLMQKKSPENIKGYNYKKGVELCPTI